MSDSDMNVEELQRELTESTELVVELREENEQLHDNWATLQEAYTRLQHAHTTVQNRVQQVVNEKAQLQRGHEELCSKWKSELDMRARQFEEMKAHVLPPHEIEMLRMKIMEEMDLPHKEMCMALEAENEKYRQTVFELKRDLQLMQEEKFFVEQQGAKALAEAQAEHESVTTDLQTHITHLMEQAEDVLEQEVIEATQRENAALHIRVKHLVDELSSVRQSKEQARVDKESGLASLKERIMELQYSLSRSQAEGEALHRKNRHIERELDETMKSHERTQEYTAKLEHELQSLRSSFEETERQRVSERQAHQKATYETESQRERDRIEMEGRLEASLRERQQIQSRYNEQSLRLEKEGQEATARVREELESVIAGKEKALQEARKQVEDLHASMSERESALTADLADMQQRCAALEAERQAVEAEHKSEVIRASGDRHHLADALQQKEVTVMAADEMAAELKSLQDKCRTLMQQEHNLMVENEKLALTAEYLAKDHASTKDELAEVQAKTAAVVDELRGQAKVQVKTLSVKMARKVSKHKEVANKAKDLARRCKEHYSAKCKGMQRRVQALEATVTGLEEAVVRGSEECSAAQRRLRESERRCEELQAVSGLAQ